MLSGSVVSQLIGFFSTIVIVFGFSNKDIANYGLYYSIVSILSMILSFRMENLIYRYSEKDGSSNYASFIIIFSLLNALFLFCLLIAFGFISSSSLDLSYWLLVFFGGVSYSLYNVLINFLVRNSEGSLIVTLKIGRVVVEFMLVVIFTAINNPINYIMFSMSCGYFLSSLVCFIICDKYKTPSLDIILFHFKEWRSVYIHSKFDFPASLCNAAVLHYPQLLLSLSGNVLLASLYFQITRFVGTPTLIVSQSIGLALKQHAQKEFDLSNKCVNSIRTYSKYLYGKLLPLVFFCSSIITLTLLYIKFDYNINNILVSFSLVLVFIVRFMFNVLSPVVYVYGLYKDNFKYQLFLLMSSCISLIFYSSSIYLILTYSLFVSLVYISYINFISGYSMETVNG
jgi:O-antigen/teichoic acid export membrane protein